MQFSRYIRMLAYCFASQLLSKPMENTRFELVTSCLQGRRSPNWANPPYDMGLSGLEPPTSRLSGVRSNRLSYKPISWIRGGCPAPCTLILLDISVLVEMNGIEPMTPCLQSRCSPSWATPPYSIEHRASLFCCSAHSVSSWKLFHFLFTFLHEKKVKFGLPNFQCAYFLCTIGPSKLNNTNNSNFVIPDLGC